jgi:hypothetical protein
MTNISKASLRVIMRLEVLPEAKEKIVDYCNRIGMTQVATNSRLVEWLCQQPDIIQAGVLGLYPEDIRAELPSIVLKRLAVGKKK